MKRIDDLSAYRALRGGRRSPPPRFHRLTLVTQFHRRHFGHFDVAHAVARELGGRHLWRNHVAHAWVLLPDRAHLVCELAGDESLLELVSRIKYVTATLGNSVLGEKGAFWARGHHARALRTRQGMHKAVHDLVAAPSRAGLAESPWDWPFWNSRWIRCFGDLVTVGDRDTA